MISRRGFLAALGGFLAARHLPVVREIPAAIEPVQAVVGEYADYLTVTDFDVAQAISYNVRFTVGYVPDAVQRIRRVTV